MIEGYGPEKWEGVLRSSFLSGVRTHEDPRRNAGLGKGAVSHGYRKQVGKVGHGDVVSSWGWQPFWGLTWVFREETEVRFPRCSHDHSSIQKTVASLTGGLWQKGAVVTGCDIGVVASLTGASDTNRITRTPLRSTNGPPQDARQASRISLANQTTQSSFRVTRRRVDQNTLHRCIDVIRVAVGDAPSGMRLHSHSRDLAD